MAKQGWLAYWYQKKEGEFWPVTATFDLKDRSLACKETVRVDVLRVPEDHVFASGTPGGWAMVGNSLHAAAKKWVVLRGDFLFIFKDEKEKSNPRAVIPLRECADLSEVPPDADATTFSLRFTYKNATEHAPATLGFAAPDVAAE